MTRHKTKSLSADQILESARAAVNKRERELGTFSFKREKGFYTRREWSERWQRGKDSTKLLLNKHLKSGKMKGKMITIARIDGQAMPVMHYAAVK